MNNFQKKALCIAFVLLTTVYVFTLVPSVHWLDTGELIASAHHLVAGHPPGEPVFMILSKAFSLLPCSNIAFRMNFLSALSQSGSFVVFVLILKEFSSIFLSKSLDKPYEENRLSNILHFMLGASAPFLTYPFWIQAVRAEVYSMQLLVELAFIYTLLRAGIIASQKDKKPLDHRFMYISAFLVGISCGIHPLLTATVLIPSIIVLMTNKSFWNIRLWSQCIFWGVYGFSNIIFLPIRAFVHKGYGWGEPITISAFLDMLFAKTFQKNFSEPTPNLLQKNIAVIFDAMLSFIGYPIVFFAIMMLATICIKKHWRLALWVIGLLVCNLWTILSQNKVFTDNPDLHGYILLSHLCIWGLFIVGLYSLLLFITKERAHLRILSIPVIIILSVGGVIISLAPSDRSNDDIPEIFAKTAYKNLPYDAWLQVAGNDTSFLLVYFKDVLLYRPDVHMISKSLVTHDWFWKKVGFSIDSAYKASLSGEDLFSVIPKNSFLRVEFRDSELEFSHNYCPSPEPGWGFFDRISSSNECYFTNQISKPPSVGILSHEESFHGPEGFAIGAYAKLMLIEYYKKLGKTSWADEEQKELDRIYTKP